MERSLWLSAALALGSAACSAGGGGSSSIVSGDPSTAVDAGGVGMTGGMNTGGTPGMTTGGNSDNSSTGGTSSSTTGGDFCEQVTVRANKVIPDILIVLDKSASMVWVGCKAANNPPQAGCANDVSTTPPYQMPFDRWQPSVAALKTTTAALQERVRFGLMIFPDAAIPGAFPPFTTQGCQPGVMFVDPALNTATQIASELDMEAADGDSTPIPGTLKAAHDSLGTGIAAPDATPTPKYVLLVTDGSPNCLVDGTPATTAEEANNQSYAEVDSLTTDGIKTYVIGYDTRSTADFAVVLDEMARRGGTGDTQHREVTDENSLLEAISAIAGEITTCTYQLDKAPPDVKKVRVTLDGKDRKNGAEGWELTGEKTIELRGAACTEIQNAEKEHTLAINVECEDVIIQ